MRQGRRYDRPAYVGWKASEFTGQTWSTSSRVWRWHLNAYFLSCASGLGSKYSTAILPSTEAVAYPSGPHIRNESKRSASIRWQGERPHTDAEKGRNEMQDLPCPSDIHASARVMNFKLLSRVCSGFSIFRMSKMWKSRLAIATTRWFPTRSMK